MGLEKKPHEWIGAETEWKIFETICNEELGDNSPTLDSGKFGIISHSGKLPNQVRIAMEKLMAKCAPKIIVSTTTLGQGVNIGISSVIFETVSIGYDRKNECLININKRDFWNICGRAGRAFIDGEGKMLFAIDSTAGSRKVSYEEGIAKDYFNILNLDKVESGVMKIMKNLITLCEDLDLSLDRFLDLVESDDFSQFNDKERSIKSRFDLVDDELLALHLSSLSNNLGDLENVDWVNEAFSQSLASIQLEKEEDKNFLIRLLKSRTKGLLSKIDPSDRGRIASSGLPFSIAVPALNHIDFFRKIIDDYLEGEQSIFDISNLILHFEKWSKTNAESIIQTSYEEEFLNKIRIGWISGEVMSKIKEKLDKAEKNLLAKALSDFYGYQMPWIINSIAQKLDKEIEGERIDVLLKIALLLELGLPTENTAKVFLSGIRSRSASLELGQFVSNPDATISGIRRGLLDKDNFKQISDQVSSTTAQWLKLMADEHENNTDVAVNKRMSSFRLDAPDHINTLHVRQTLDNFIYLCSIDCKFKFKVKSDEKLPFKNFTNDPRFVFSRNHDNIWDHECRYPNLWD